MNKTQADMSILHLKPLNDHDRFLTEEQMRTHSLAFQQVNNTVSRFNQINVKNSSANDAATVKQRAMDIVGRETDTIMGSKIQF